jgi:hypothetical protein
MTQNRAIILILLALAFVASYALELPNELVNFFLATGLLAFELYETFKLRQLNATTTTFQLSSNEWLGGLGMTGFIIYYFSDEPMNVWNICAIAEAVIFGVFYAVRNRTLTYSIEDIGIRNLFDGKLLDSSTITNIQFNDEQLAIDTTKYQNDLVIKSSNLRSPNWNELTSELTKLTRNGG